MEFQIEQYSDEIKVYSNGVLFLYVRRKYNFFGKLFSEFYQKEELILKTTYNDSFFRIRISVLFQELPCSLSLKKIKGNYIGIVNSKEFRKERTYFKNPVYKLFESNRKIGEVSTKLTGITETPTIYYLRFYSESETNFYSLLVFLIGLSPEYS
jgi:hypothetical protein